MEYRNLIRSLDRRYNPDGLPLFEQREYSSVLETEVATYVRKCMNKVDDEYTRKIKAAGNAVRQHLEEELQHSVTFKYQGSVMTETHIKGASDIDLLVFTDRFVNTEIFKVRNMLINCSYNSYNDYLKLKQYDADFTHYLGNSLQDMRDLRKECEIILSKWYAKCDTNKSKAIHIVNQKYDRDVDIVIASWQDRVPYILHPEVDTYRGVTIYNKEKDGMETPSCPFLGIDNIKQRNSATGGRLCQMIRFLKNVRTDSSENIDLSSFELNAICYAIPTSEYYSMTRKEMVNLLTDVLYTTYASSNIAINIPSVDGTEYVFQKNNKKIAEVGKLYEVVRKINGDLGN